MVNGDKIKITDGKYKGRLGEFLKNCSLAFADYYRVKLDLKGREKEKKVIMILKEHIKVT